MSSSTRRATKSSASSRSKRCCRGTPVIVCNDSGCGEVIGRNRRRTASVPPGDVPRPDRRDRDRCSPIQLAWRSTRRAAPRQVFGSDSDRRPRLRAARRRVPQTSSMTHPLLQDACVTRDARRRHLRRAGLNGARSLRPAIDGIVAQRDGRPFEIIASTTAAPTDRCGC